MLPGIGFDNAWKLSLTVTRTKVTSKVAIKQVLVPISDISLITS